MHFRDYALLLAHLSTKDLLCHLPCFVQVKSQHSWGEGSKERDEQPAHGLQYSRPLRDDCPRAFLLLMATWHTLVYPPSVMPCSVLHGDVRSLAFVCGVTIIPVESWGEAGAPWKQLCTPSNVMTAPW